MATMRIVSTTLALAATALAARSTSPAAPAASPQGDAVFSAPAVRAVEGTWTAKDLQGEGMQLRLLRDASMWGNLLPRSELRGLTDAQIASGTSAPVSFRIERAAGVFQMDGVFHEGSGAGRFRFLPERGFTRTLASLGIAGAEQSTDVDLMLLANGNVSAATVREFTELGLGPLTMQDLVALGTIHVTPAYVRSLRSAGLAGTSTVAGLVRLRLHRITAEYVRELEGAGYRDLPSDQLLRMGIFGVSGEQVRELEAAGYRNLSPDELVEMRIYSVTPAFIQEMREAGLGDLTPRELVRLRLQQIH